MHARLVWQGNSIVAKCPSLTGTCSSGIRATVPVVSRTVLMSKNVQIFTYLELQIYHGGPKEYSESLPKVASCLEE